MGAGKTTIGKLLSKSINWDFLDLDQLIEKNQNESIKQIFSKKGEAYFRKIESKILSEVSTLSKYVIATGGGIVIQKQNIKVMQNTGIQIWLKWHINNLILNAKKQQNQRPLLSNDQNFIKLYLSREPLYAQANITIPCDSLNPHQIVKKILKSIDKCNII